MVHTALLQTMKTRENCDFDLLDIDVFPEQINNELWFALMALVT